MTTLVTIQNSSLPGEPDNHIILVKRGGALVQKLYPGEKTTQVNVWANQPLTIEEDSLA